METETMRESPDKMSLEDINSILAGLDKESQGQVIPVETRNIKEYQDLFILAQKPENSLLNRSEITNFFDEAIAAKSHNLVFSADCRKEFIITTRNMAVDYLRSMGVLVSEAEKHDLMELVGEVIDDAARNFGEATNPRFIVKIKINPDNPKDYSFCIINPSTVLSEDFKHAEHVTGLGTGMKAKYAEELDGKIKNIDIMGEDGNKKYHGVEFKKTSSALSEEHSEELLEQVA